MTPEQLFSFWQFEEGFPFIGWDFGHLNGRQEDEPLPWDYSREVQRWLKPESRLLDIETGAGEYLLSLRHPYERTSVTEAWPPNVELCRNRLAPLGIRVEACDAGAEPLPFADNCFDVVLCRHGAYLHEEVFRVLRPGGVFVTQQVGGRNNTLLARRLLRDYLPPFPGHHLSADCARFGAAGFNVLDAKEYFPKTRFFDTGAIVYYAKAIAWEFPGFSVERCRHELFALEREMRERGYVESMGHRYLIAAQKPARA